MKLRFLRPYTQEYVEEGDPRLGAAIGRLGAGFEAGDVVFVGRLYEDARGRALVMPHSEARRLVAGGVAAPTNEPMMGCKW